MGLALEDVTLVTVGPEDARVAALTSTVLDPSFIQSAADRGLDRSS